VKDLAEGLAWSCCRRGSRRIWPRIVPGPAAGKAVKDLAEDRAWSCCRRGSGRIWSRIVPGPAAGEAVD
jgi:hypothetical protein